MKTIKLTVKELELLNEIKNDPTFFEDPGVYYYWEGGWWEQSIVKIPTSCGITQRLICFKASFFIIINVGIVITLILIKIDGVTYLNDYFLCLAARG